MPVTHAAAAVVQSPSTIDTHRMSPRPDLVTAPSLRYWRHQLAVPQRELAERARLDITTVQRLEAGGSARLSTIPRLADALEITPAQLMRESPED